ncbi:hypothetical protein [Kocuria sp.]|uniref:hypothetical protein n=1 Tax=Kocuria sp. TaxID=1871328 RepID=UPI0028AFE1D2|nr:hypothetical protein [Kocuria sp.]
MMNDVFISHTLTIFMGTATPSGDDSAWGGLRSLFVTLLAGFIGAGVTHVLSRKRSIEDWERQKLYESVVSLRTMHRGVREKSIPDYEFKLKHAMSEDEDQSAGLYKKLTGFQTACRDYLNALDNLQVLYPPQDSIQGKSKSAKVALEDYRREHQQAVERFDGMPSTRASAMFKSVEAKRVRFENEHDNLIDHCRSRLVSGGLTMSILAGLKRMPVHVRRLFGRLRNIKLKKSQPGATAPRK